MQLPFVIVLIAHRIDKSGGPEKLGSIVVIEEWLSDFPAAEELAQAKLDEYFPESRYVNRQTDIRISLNLGYPREWDKEPPFTESPYRSAVVKVEALMQRWWKQWDEDMKGLFSDVWAISPPYHLANLITEFFLKVPSVEVDECRKLFGSDKVLEQIVRLSLDTILVRESRKTT